jgi:two-component system chemotaxis response regulator CheY
VSIEVLVVDDSSTVRAQVGRTLRSAGYSVVEATDGIQGLERIAERAPALVVCDVNMPRMSGIELLERLRDQGTAVPVVMLTTEGQPEIVRRARELGARGWIIKPFKPELLLSAVKKVAGLQ